MNTVNVPAVTVHMIGNAHIDPVWLWPLSEGRAEVLASYRTAMGLIEEFDGYVFTSGGAVTYRWVAEDDPELFAAIRHAVSEGRWALVNGWWLQPDCNIPGGESFARHALYGQRYLLQQFGRRACVGYNVDSFGHAGTLPQLLRLAGLDYYVFFRPGPHEMTLPQTPFWWEAPDGSRVLACRPPLHYNSPEEDDVHGRVHECVARATRGLPSSEAKGLPHVMCFYGVGNHGGGPTRENVRVLQEMMAEGGRIVPVFSSPERYLHEVEALGREWPTVKEELQHHARGCYTALSRVKRENRLAEHALMRAERFSALASLLCGAPNEQRALQEAWEGVLFNQFHDILAGTSIRSAYEDVWDLYDGAQRTAHRVESAALDALSADVAVRAEGQGVLVWNPLAWERSEAVRFRVPMGGFRDDRLGVVYPRAVTVADDCGDEVPAQIVDVELDYSTYMAHVEALVTVPALGCRVLDVWLTKGEPPAEEPCPPPVTEVDNGILRLRFDADSGWLAGLTDMASGVEFLTGPGAVPLVIDDPSDTWSHGVDAFRVVIGRFGATRAPQLVTDGPVRRTVRVAGAWGSSEVVQEFTLYRDAPWVDVTLTVDWHERHRMLKLAFPLAIEEVTVTASAPYGHVRRGADGEEHPCQAWVDLTGSRDGQLVGLAVLNDGKYGYDALDGELRLSVLRSPIYAFHDPRQVVPGVTYHYIDQGAQVIHYRVIPHLGPWPRALPDRRAYELQEPLIARPATRRAAGAPSGPLLSVEPDNMVLTVVKRSEDGDGFLVRGYEAEGRAGEVVIRCAPLGRCWRHRVRAHEVWTLALSVEDDRVEGLNLLEEPL